jgi:Galactose oxidase, central domain/Kelch motif
LATPPLNHTATLLDDGTILVAGGVNCAALRACFIDESALFHAGSGTFISGLKMTVPRTLHTATRLPNGQVLVAGGNNSTGPLASTELFDPASGSFTVSGGMAQARRQHTATLLGNGRVLMAGGFTVDASGNQGLLSAELYDPASGSFSSAGAMSTARAGHTASLLNDGRVLIAGGDIPCVPAPCGSAPNALASELYDPDTNTFSATGGMAAARFQHTATVLPSGLVVVAGGQTIQPGGAESVPVASIEIYDPATGTFSPGGNLLVARRSHTATLLPDGQVLFTGGIDINGAIKSAEIYTPSTQTSTAVSDMSVDRTFHTATLLPNGQVAILGGSPVTGKGEIFK